MRSKENSAFSLLEVSVVLIIVGIFIAGVVAANGMVSKFRITAAQTLSRSSPINEVPDAAMWLETSLDTSFNSSESSDTSPLTTWYDSRTSMSKVTVQAVSGNPTYSNTINRIHAVKFNGSGYFTFDGSFLNKSDYTIFILEKRESASAGNYFLGDSSVTTPNQNLLLGYSADGQVTHGQGTNAYAAGISNYSSSGGSPRVFTFTQSATAGKKTYINGVLAAQSSDTTKLSGISTLSIGQGYTGQIGEVAIFTRALEPDERIAIEDYVGKKWSSKINRANVASCIDGTVTLNGCDSSTLTTPTPTTCAVSVSGVSSTTAVASGSGTLTCDVTGYTGTSAYTCASGTLTAATCACASGYAASGVACVASGANCTGGTIDNSVSGYVIHKFLSSGTFTCPAAKTVEVLVVAGGGGGGGGGGGAGGAGGGAGGVIYNSSFSVSTSPITVTVGNGGAGGPGNNYNLAGVGSNGANSVFSSLTAIGGGGSGAREDSGAAGLSGGSGGGGGISGTSKAGGSATSGQGNAGGANGQGGNYGGGGGGGAGAVGQNGTSSKGGNGGVGLQYSISGTSTYYAGGGAASYYSSGGTFGTGGLGGGGSVGVAGTANTGGGGGGGATTSDSGLSGGSGIVIVRYSSGPATSCAVSVTGVTSPATVSIGASGSLTCNASGYSGSVAYTCPSTGTLSVTGNCTAPIVTSVVLTSGASYTVPSGVTQVKVWAIGAGGGGGGAGGAGGGGGAGGVAYKTWTVSSGNTITYSIGNGGAGGFGSGQSGATGGNTTVTISGVTITGNGGGGGRGDNATASVGGSFSGGDGGAAGGGTVGISGDRGGSAGAAIGGVNGTVPPDTAFGGTGANSADVSALFTTLAAVGGYPTVSGGAGSDSSRIGDQINHGSAATGFGCGGGGAGWWGGNGGAGRYGGGGGGAAGEGSSRTGGAGGAGAVVLKFF